ncbi:MAG: ComF family protein [Candidatus Nitrospinota bacterium M3_3B_026]
MEAAGILRLAASLRSLFPGRCAACGCGFRREGGGVLCPSCEGAVVLPPKNICCVCGRPLDFDYEIETGETYACGECIGKRRPYSKLRFALVYEGPVRELVHKFKFQGQRRLAGPLSELGRGALVPWMEASEAEVIVPVPLAARKLFGRGYNHAYLLARLFGEWAGLEVAEGALRRVRPTAPQFGLTRDERRKNVRGAFSVYGERAIRGRRVILFDDIHTTGATVEECCKTLKKARPKEILVVTLCRAGE